MVLEAEWVEWVVLAFRILRVRECLALEDNFGLKFLSATSETLIQIIRFIQEHHQRKINV